MPAIDIDTHVPPSGALALAQRFAAQARQQQWRSVRACSLVAALVLAGAVLAWVAWLHLQRDGARLLAPLLAHPGLVAFVVALTGWHELRRQRRRQRRRFADSWLATAPIPAVERDRWLRGQVARNLLLPVVLVLALVGAAAAASGTRVTSLLLWMTAAGSVGAALGWRDGGVDAPASRAPRVVLTRHHGGLHRDLRALGRWPLLHATVHAQPQLHARVMAALLLGLPAGLAPSIAVLLIALVATVLAATALLGGVLAVIPAAAEALRSTPLGIATFARATCLRSLIWLFAGGVSAAVLLALLGTSAASLLVFAATWLACCLTALGSALAGRYRAQRLAAERFALGLVLSALAVALPWALLLALPAVWTWQLAQARSV